MLKTLSIGRMDNLSILRRFSRMAILVQMLIFGNKTQKPRAITYWTHQRMLLRLLGFSTKFYLDRTRL